MELIREENGLKYYCNHSDYLDNPREWACVCKLLVTDNRYLNGDGSIEDLSFYDKKNHLFFPVYAYIHSNITLSLTPFSCRFDSGQIGVAVVRKKSYLIDMGWKILTKKRRESLKNTIQNELEVYSKYLNGEGYCVIVKDESGDIVDSLYGFYSYDDAVTCAKNEL